MKNNFYKVNEIFRSVQAEGINSGRSAVFVRFSGCNLNCKFCDTNHELAVKMTATQINEEIKRLSGGDESVLVVFTGGEPTLQLHENEIIGGNHPKAIETNGILQPPMWIRWVTVSPKTKLQPIQLRGANEVKILYGMFEDEYLESLIGIHANLFIQPMEQNGYMNINDCINFINKHPQFRLSVQWHKLTGVR